MAQGLPTESESPRGLLLGGFPVRLPDGVNRGKVEHVKSHFGNIGETRFTISECAVRLIVAYGGTWEHFIPRR